MIKYLKYDLIDKQKWDNCIDNAFNGSIYAYSWYLDIVCEEWDALVEGDYESVFPIPFKKKMGIHIIYQPFFTQQLGVFTRSKLTPDIVNEFLEAIPSRFKLIDLNLNIHNQIDLSGFSHHLMVNHELDLISDYEQLRKNYSTNTRRNLIKAEKSDLFIVKEVKPDDIIELFRENRGKGIKVLKEFNYLRLRRLIYTCIYRDAGKVYAAYTSENELCAGAVFIESHRKPVFIFSGQSEKGKEKRAMFLLIDHFIKEHANKHLTLDFDGSNDEALSRFYKGFGSTRIDYLRISRNTLPLYNKVALKIYRKLKS